MLPSRQPCLCGKPIPAARTAACSSACRAELSRRRRVEAIRQALLGALALVGRPAPPEAPPARPPLILQLDLHDFAVVAWVRDEHGDGEPVYRIVRQGIKAARIAASLARTLAE